MSGRAAVDARAASASRRFRSGDTHAPRLGEPYYVLAFARPVIQRVRRANTSRTACSTSVHVGVTGAITSKCPAFGASITDRPPSPAALALAANDRPNSLNDASRSAITIASGTPMGNNAPGEAAR